MHYKVVYLMLETRPFILKISRTTFVNHQPDKNHLEFFSYLDKLTLERHHSQEIYVCRFFIAAYTTVHAVAQIPVFHVLWV